jgi:carbonic anhydrase
LNIRENRELCLIFYKPVRIFYITFSNILLVELRKTRKKEEPSMKMKFISLSLFISLSFFIGACAEHTLPLQGEKTKHTEIEQTAYHIQETNSALVVHWSYDENTGPQYWGELDPSYRACAVGKEQSPINIEVSQAKMSENLELIVIQYKPTIFSIEHNGKTIQVNPETRDNSVMIDGIEYKMEQFHFHTPSEHQLNGKHNHMELHLVHKDKNAKILVLGFLITEGHENKVLSPLWDALPIKETDKAIIVKNRVELQALIPQDRTAFSYKGSLTTPPCTEEVKCKMARF